MSTTSVYLRMVSGRPRPADFVASRETSKFVGGLSKAEAEELLDWLEANDRTNCELSGISEYGFAVWFK